MLGRPNPMDSALSQFLAREFGFSILPLGSDKRPRGPWSRYQVMAPSVETVAKMGAYTGVVTGTVSGVVVVDTDDGVAEAWAKANLPATPWMVLTGLRADGSRGVHRYYRMPEGVDVRNRSNCCGLKIDVRGNGGYVVAPGVLHSSGVRYQPTEVWQPEQLAELPVYDDSWFQDAESQKTWSGSRGGPRIGLQNRDTGFDSRPGLQRDPRVILNSDVWAIECLREIAGDEAQPLHHRLAAARAILSIDPTPDELALLSEMESASEGLGRMCRSRCEVMA